MFLVCDRKATCRRKCSLHLWRPADEELLSISFNQKDNLPECKIVVAVEFKVLLIVLERNVAFINSGHQSHQKCSCHKKFFKGITFLVLCLYSRWADSLHFFRRIDEDENWFGSSWFLKTEFPSTLVCHSSFSFLWTWRFHQVRECSFGTVTRRLGNIPDQQQGNKTLQFRIKGWLPYKLSNNSESFSFFFLVSSLDMTSFHFWRQRHVLTAPENFSGIQARFLNVDWCPLEEHTIMADAERPYKPILSVRNAQGPLGREACKGWGWKPLNFGSALRRCFHVKV